MREANDKVAKYRTIVKRLQNLKTGIDSGKYPYDDFTPNGFAIPEFSTLSQSFVDGDDIASVDSLTRQAYNEKNYIWNVLLKGPEGCEQELKNDWIGKNHFPYQLYINKRPAYPFPILYDYNDYAQGALLPNGPFYTIGGTEKFDSTEDYKNYQAFGNADPMTFLGTAFMMSSGLTLDANVDENGNRVYPNVFDCADSTGIRCGGGQYGSAPTFEKYIEIY